MIHLTSEVIDSSAILRPTYSCIPVQPRTAAYNRVHLYRYSKYLYNCIYFGLPHHFAGLPHKRIDFAVSSQHRYGILLLLHRQAATQPAASQPARRRCAAANSNCARCRGASQVSHTPTPASSSLLAPRLTATGAGGRWEAMPPVAVVARRDSSFFVERHCSAHLL